MGFLGEDLALVVELVLRGGGLAVTPVEGTEQLRGFDVALVDVPPGGDATGLARAVPAGPTVVLLTHEGWGVPGTTVVRRPCSLRTLVDVLWGTGTEEAEGDVVVTLERPSPTPSPPLFTAASAPPPRPPPPDDDTG